MADKTTPASTTQTTAATLVTTVSGTIIIGTTSPITIPISTTIPPTTPGVFSFSYTASPPASGTKIPVGDFIAWAAAQIDPNIKPGDLPTSLQTLNVAVDELTFDTNGNFDIKVEIGKMDGTTPKWDPTWQPIPGLTSFIISDVTLEVKRTPGS